MSTEKRKITVLHVILSLDVGGMEQIVSDLVKGLDPQRFTPVVICLELLGEIAEELTGKGIRVIRLSPMVPVISMLYPASLIRSILDIKPDVVHLHSGCWFKGALAARLAGISRIIYTDHGRPVPDPAWRIMLDRLSCRLTKSVVAVSPQLAQYLGNVVGIPAGKLSVIINGIDVDRFRLAEAQHDRAELRIGVIARLEPVKDIATLLLAMKMIVETYPKITLDVVGAGPERENLEQMAAKLGIAPNVIFHGLRRDIPQALAGIDISALSSLSEGTSITILEAMAAGLPVVATRVGGTPAIIAEGVNGFLVPPSNPEEMAKALLLLIKDKRLRRNIGNTNRSRAGKEYSLHTMVQRYEELYV